MHKAILNSLQQIKTLIANHKLSPQDAIDKTVKACQKLGCQNALNDAMNDNQISNAEDYADTARERIVNNLRTQNEQFIVLDGEDLKYIDEQHPKYVNSEDACGQPLDYRDALDLVKSIQKTLTKESEEAVSHD